MIYLQNNNKSFIRIGDGEIMMLNKENILNINTTWINNEPNDLILFNDEKYINWLEQIIKLYNRDLLIGIQVANYDELIYIYSNNFWFKCNKKRKYHYINDNIYLDCLIGRTYAYLFNVCKYYEIFFNKYKNKKAIIVCNQNDIMSLINKYYYVLDNSIYIIVRGRFDRSITKSELNNTIDDISDKIKNYISIDKNIKNCFIQYGLFSKFICDKISSHIQIIDLGELVSPPKLKYNSMYYYDINNVLSSINYYIFHNNVIGYDIVKNSTDILDESNPVIINIKEIISLNDKLEPNIQLFGIRFNQISLSNNYLNSIIKGKLTVKSNIPLKLFNGKNWLHINIDSYENDFDIYNINKWRISPSNEYLNENIGKNNIEFIIYHIGFKIYEII